MPSLLLPPPPPSGPRCLQPSSAQAACWQWVGPPGSGAGPSLLDSQPSPKCRALRAHAGGGAPVQQGRSRRSHDLSNRKRVWYPTQWDTTRPARRPAPTDIQAACRQMMLTVGSAQAAALPSAVQRGAPEEACMMQCGRLKITRLRRQGHWRGCAPTSQESRAVATPQVPLALPGKGRCCCRIPFPRHKKSAHPAPTISHRTPGPAHDSLALDLPRVTGLRP